MGRYGHSTIEAQFNLALKQVRQRLRDQEQSQNGKVRSSKSPSRRVKQRPPRCLGTKNKFIIAMPPQNRAQSVMENQIGSRLEKTFEAILQMNRVDGKPTSFESSTKQELSQRPASESNQVRSTKQRLISTSNSENRRLQEIQEERNIGGPNSSSQELLLLECQQITPVKPKMAWTGNNFAPGGKPIEKDQPNRRVMSSSNKKRPQSAHNTQEDIFESNISKQ